MAGSLEQRGANSWRIILSAGYDSKGKRVKVTRTFHGTRSDAEQMLAQLVAVTEQRKVAGAADMTLTEWAHIWFREYVDAKLAGATRAMYHTVFPTRILPALGHIRLDQLLPRHIGAFLGNLAEEGARQDGRDKTISAATIIRYLRILSACLEAAVTRQLIPTNPAHNVNVPHQRSGRQTFTTLKEIGTLLAALEGEPPRVRAMVLLALSAGLRRGELVALEWSHLDLSTGRLCICQTAELLAGHPQSIQPLKNLIRTISLPEETLEAVHIWQQAQALEHDKAGLHWQDHPFIFTQPSGSWMRADEVTKQFRKFFKRHGLPIISLDRLRNFAPDIAIDLGIPELTCDPQ